MNRRLRHCLVAVCTAALLVSCGGDDASEDDAGAPATSSSGSAAPEEADTEPADPDAQPYADAIAEASGAGQYAMDAEQAQCFGAGVVDVVGLEQLEAAGTPEEVGAEFSDFDLMALELSAEQGEGVYDSLGACGYDVRADLMDSLLAGEEDEQTRACIEDAVGEDTLRDFVVVMMTRGGEAAQTSKPWRELEQSLGACEPAPKQ